MKGYCELSVFAERMGVSYGTARRWAKDGRIRTLQLVKRGKHWVPDSELARLQERDWLSLHELASELGISYVTAKLWKREGKFDYLQPRKNGAVRVHRSELKRLLQEREG